MALVIRDAGVADAALLARLNTDVQQLHADAWPSRFKEPSDTAAFAAHFADYLAKPLHFAFIAEVDGEPAGYLAGLIIEREDNAFKRAETVLHVDQIGVQPAARRRGAGRALLDAARARGAAAGVTTITLDTWAFNGHAQGFFATCGFERYMVRMWSR